MSKVLVQKTFSSLNYVSLAIVVLEKQKQKNQNAVADNYLSYLS